MCILMCFSLSTTMQPISTTFVTPTPTPSTIPTKSRCAKRSRALSADQVCSGGANIAEILTNESLSTDVSRISRLYSHLCSSQKCFKKFVRTYSDCIVDLSGVRENATAKKQVSLHAHTVGALVHS